MLNPMTDIAGRGTLFPLQDSVARGVKVWTSEHARSRSRFDKELEASVVPRLGSPASFVNGDFSRVSLGASLV